MSDTILSKLDRAVKIIDYHVKSFQSDIDRMASNLEVSHADRIRVGRMQEFLQAVDILKSNSLHALKNNLGRIPPAALDLEQAIIGAILLEKTALPAVVKFLLPEHFYSEPHNVIYTACVELHKKNEPIDMRTALTKLRAMGKAELVGGGYYIAELTSKVSSAGNIEYHARIVMEMAIKRNLIMLCNSIMMDCYEIDTDCFELKERAEKEFENMNTWIK